MSRLTSLEIRMINLIKVSKDFVLSYEQKERENAEKLSNQVDRHIQTLKKLRAQLEDRSEIR
jgi:hypothetical protein